MKKAIMTIHITVYSLLLLLVIKDFFPSLLIFDSLTTTHIALPIITFALLEAILSYTTKTKSDKEHFWINIIAMSVFILFILLCSLQGIESQSGLVSPVLFIVILYTAFETYKKYKEMKKTTTPDPT
ncbi:hypothetical protein [Alkalicoccobacillus porphyridii]|uniref:Uncharacterized protein n=1 Tax=Alkalicoccobacillus porphyridii TaxID=2597270 RepID=A0A554A1B4_9BACI|nr:hypothetical protein [Alkalicoccobacillus porphyridii]TSB47481.1 hypothetical protein FN960_07025 [Alkalicoccobacillus porphyridii]